MNLRYISIANQDASILFSTVSDHLVMLHEKACSVGVMLIRKRKLWVLSTSNLVRAVNIAGVRRNGLAKLTDPLQVAVSLLPFMSPVNTPRVSTSMAIQVAVAE